MEQDIKRRRFLLLACAAVVMVTLAALYLLGSVLLPLGLSVVAAYVLLPVARLMEGWMPWRRSRPGLSRGISIGVIYLAGLGIMAGGLALAIPPTVEQSQQFAEDFPGFFSSARETLEYWFAQYSDRIPVEIRDQIEGALSDSGGIVSDAVWNVVSQTWNTVSSSFALILGLSTAPVLVFYLMKDSGRIRASLYAPFPQDLQVYLKELLNIAEKALGGYIRGQLVLGIAVGSVVTVGLLLLGVPFSFVLGIIAGVTELIPIIGPWLGGIAGVLVVLAVAPDKALWVILLYLGVQLLENTLLVPRIQGDTLNLHPVALILVIVIASHYFGIWGVIIGPPLVAMLKDMAIWFARGWNHPRPYGEMMTEDGAGSKDEPAPQETEDC